jgi:hypothetical protein
MESRTFGSALGTYFKFQNFNFLGIGLLALWAMSPIGSQAVMRLLSLKLATHTSPISMAYFDTDTESVFAIVASNPTETLTTISSVYVTALLSPSDAKNGPVDLWGNIKIPLQSSLNATNDGVCVFPAYFFLM